MAETVGVLKIGDKCTHCGEDTSWMSGKFVNRIPSLADSEQASGWYAGWDGWDSFDGYLCASCQGGDEDGFAWCGS